MEKYTIDLCTLYKEHYKAEYNIIFNIFENNEKILYSLRIPKSLFSYDKLVSDLIKLRYNNDQMQAIINNYLLDNETNENAVEEFKTMQDWRKLSKTIAKDILSRIS